jgi:predicted HicB family RNase H-like nuclease
MSFETATHGRYQIKSGPLAGVWGANAFRQNTVVAKASGPTREDAIAAVKAELARIDREALEECDHEGAPSAKVYEHAFAKLLPTMIESYVQMLRAHLAAPNQQISAAKLAVAAGYSGYEGANLHYGKLGQRVAEEIGFEPPRRGDGTEIWTCAIAKAALNDTGSPATCAREALSESVDSQHFQWKMRPQVTLALRALGL